MFKILRDANNSQVPSVELSERVMQFHSKPCGLKDEEGRNKRWVFNPGDYVYENGSEE